MSSLALATAHEIRATRRLALARWLAYFALVDLLFLPYFQLVIMPFSLPLVLTGIVLLRPKVRKDGYLTLFFFVLLGVSVSVGVSTFVPRSDEYLVENVKRIVQLFSSFAYFFFFRWVASQVPLRVSRIGSLFVAWFALLAVIFFFDPAGASEVIRGFYGRTVTAAQTLAEHLRFAYMFEDPNTAAYFFLVASSTVLMTKRSGFSLAILAGALFVLTLVTQSKGALMALALMVLLTLYPPERFTRALLSVRNGMVILALALIAYAVFISVVDTIDSNKVIKLAYERIFESPEQYASGGLRFGIWAHVVQNLAALPFGRGYVLLVDGVAARPHSDVVRMIYSYGVISLVPMLLFLFGRLGRFPVLCIPALMAFTINSLIDEQKLLALFLSLLAICVGSREREARGREEQRGLSVND